MPSWPPPAVGNASGRMMSLRQRGIYYQTKPTSHLESTKGYFAKPKKVQFHGSCSPVQAPNNNVYYCQMGEMRLLAKWKVCSPATLFTQTLKLLYPAGPLDHLYQTVSTIPVFLNVARQSGQFPAVAAFDKVAGQAWIMYSRRVAADVLLSSAASRVASSSQAAR